MRRRNLSGKPILRRFLIGMAGILLLGGCTPVEAVFAMARSTADFVPLPGNPAIHYETGTEDLARRVAPHLAPAIRSVEAVQGTFPRPVAIFLPASEAHFSRYCLSTRPAGCVVGQRLFLSPRLRRETARIGRVLIHELSHLQLGQTIGPWHFQTRLPSWFKEGLAVYISGGGGAENVSEQAAVAAIRRGRTFRPEGEGHLLFTRTASDYGLKPHMFYRQAALFVRWWHDTDPERFARIFPELEKGRSLDEALVSAYGLTVEAGWQRFRASFDSASRSRQPVRSTMAPEPRPTSAML